MGMDKGIDLMPVLINFHQWFYKADSNYKCQHFYLSFKVYIVFQFSKREILWSESENKDIKTLHFKQSFSAQITVVAEYDGYKHLKQK